MRGVLLVLCLLGLAACEPSGSAPTKPAEPTEPGIYISGEARVGVVWGD